MVALALLAAAYKAIPNTVTMQYIALFSHRTVRLPVRSWPVRAVELQFRSSYHRSRRSIGTPKRIETQLQLFAKYYR